MAAMEIVKDINARLDRIEAMLKEMRGEAQESAQEAAQPSWSEDMALIAESAEAAARLLDEASALFCNAPTAYKPFCAPASVKDAMRAAVRCLADCREALARRAGGERLDEIEPCDIELLYYQINVWGAPTEHSLLNSARIAASSLRGVAADARKGLKSRRARKGLAISFNAAVSSALRVRDYIIGDEQKEAAA